MWWSKPKYTVEELERSYVLEERTRVLKERIAQMNKLIDRLSSAFRIEQRIESTDDKLTLVTESFLGTKLLYSHEMDLLPLLDEMKKRL